MSWSFLDSAGRLKEALQAQGITPTHQVFTSGSGTYTTPAGCTAIFVECIGGGGGGGGNAATTASQVIGSGGGGGGGYASKLIANPAASYAYAVGAAGTAGSSGSGGTGGATSFGATLVAANGGGGGLQGNAAVGVTQGWVVQGGTGGAGTAGDDTEPGGPGEVGIQLPSAGASAIPIGGAGGNSKAGGGAPAPGGGASAGVNATGHGGGGSGAGSNPSNGILAGGTGATGILIVTEFYGMRPTVFPPAFELAYVEYTATVNATSSATASAVTVASAGALTFDGTTKIKVEFMAPSWTASDNSAGIVLYLFDGTTSTIVTQLFFASAVSGANGPNQAGFTVGREFTPTAGTHTYFVGINDSGAVTTTHARILVNASAAGYLRISAAN